MNQHLQTILDLIQNANHLSADEKTALLKAAKNADKELEITAFKLERTEKVKKTTAILLEETIAELEQKRKAVEAQNRELEIEAALERVRAKTMSMQKPSEFVDVINVIGEQFINLGFDFDWVNFSANGLDVSKAIDIWNFVVVPGLYQGATRLVIPFFEHPVFKKAVESVNQYYTSGNNFSVVLLNKNDKDSFLDHLFTNTIYKDLPDEVKTSGYNRDVYLTSNIVLKDTWLSLGRYDAKLLSDEQIAILKRLANAFGQAYSRFLDLQKAEAQTRESQIQLALERARAQSMIMQHSNELDDTLRVFHEQVLHLNIPSAFSFLWLPDEDKDRHIFWAAWAENNSFKSKAIDYPLARNEPATAQCLIDWKGNEPVVSYHVPPDGVENYFAAWSELIAGVDELKPEYFSDGLYYVEAFMKYGCFGVMVKNTLQEDEKKILHRFAVEFERAYTRFLDLQKAEAQARESQIQLALERVRARTMAMQHSDELGETASVLFEQFDALGEVPERVAIEIVNEKEHVFEIWATQHGGKQLDLLLKCSLDEPHVMQKMYRAWEEQKRSITIDLQGKELEEYFEFLNEAGLPVQREIFGKRRIQNVATFSKGILTIITPEPRPQETIQLLERFAAVFDGTYTRFLDLQKAEAQARESQIQLALERVRARTMAMQKSDELPETSYLLFQQVKELGLTAEQNSIAIINEERRFVELSTTVHSHHLPRTLNVPINDPYVMAKAVAAWKAKHKSLKVEVRGQELKDYNEHRNSFFETKEKFPEDQWIVNIIFFSKGWLSFSSDKDISEATFDLLKRFAAVFEQTYIRFNDLKQAEEQAKESQIQLALERVRARTMAMQRSDELKVAAALLFQQVKSLGAPAYSCGYNIWEKDEMEFTSWMSTQDGSIINGVPNIPLTEDANFIRYVESKQKGEEFFVLELRGERMQEHYEYLKTIPSFKAYFDYAISVGFDLPETQIHHLANFSQGNLLFITLGPCPEFHDVFKRFAAVFEQTYRRFLDLQKAEAQAREAQIELGLERVRARAMAMQKSDELSELVDTVFKELTKLDFALTWCIINIIDEPSLSNTVWAANPDIDKAPESYHMKFEEYPFHHAMMKGWKERKAKSVYTLEGNEKRIYDNYLFSETEFKKTPEAAQTASRAMEKYVVSFSFSNFGGLQTVGDAPLSDANLDILSRFGKVFDLTYTRFNDLKQAEAQAREAQIELALERVRARAMAMQKSIELADASQLLYHEFGNLGIDTFSCGYMFVDEAKQTQTAWVVLPDGSLLPDFITFPLTGDHVLNSRYKDWKEKKPLHVFDIQGEENKKHHRFLSNHVPPFVVEDIFSKMPDRVVFNCANFSDGYLLILAVKNFSSDEQQTIIRFAKVFEQTYTRFLDLQKAEAQAREARIEAALEKVRSRSLAMQKAEELQEVVSVVAEKLKDLGVILDANGVIICTYFPDSKDVMHWMAAPDFSSSGSFLLPYFDHPIFNDAWESKIRGDEYFSKSFPKEQKDSFFQYAFEHSDYRYFPDEFKQWIFQNDRHSLSFAWAKNSALLIPSHTGILPSEKDQEILKRFAKVFEQAYIRFMDLQKAEAQAREAQIELALERVRARTMAMQKSEELKEVIQLVYEQFAHLNINIEHTGFVMDYKARDDYDIWIADQLGVPSHVTIPYFDCVYYNRFNEAKEKGEDFFATNLDFEEKNRFYKKIIEYVPGLPEETKEFLFSIPGLAGSTVLLDNICLYIENFSGIPYSDEENNTLMRFGKVFQQTYTRFLDLQKAEAQAREAKIELAMERVRARTMAMHKSEELIEIMAVMFEQLAQLQLRTDAITLSLDYKTKLLNLWMAIPGQAYPAELKIPYINIPFINSAMKAVRSGDNFYSITCGLEEKNQWINHLFEHTIVKNTPEARKLFLLQAPGLALSLAMGKNIALLVANYAAIPFSAEENAVIKRFVNVFEQSYIRFLDLQKAEAQARESQIELGLERVRARAMAMQHSDELKELIGTVYSELTKLDIALTRCLIWLIDSENFSSRLWMANPESQPVSFYVPYHENPPYLAFVKAWKERNTSWQYDLHGSVKKDWDEFVFHNTEMKHLPEPVKKGMQATERLMLAASFHNFGCLQTAGTELLKQEQFDILNRFARVFDLTYTRFADLKKAEAQAREAQIELGLERVRSRAMAMHNSNELSELVAILFEELVKLDLILARCIIWIFDKETLAARMWMANSEDKRNANSYYIKRLNHPYYEAIIKGWKEKNSKWIYVLEGNFKKSLDELLLHETELTNLPAAVKAGIRLSERTVISGSFNNFGFIEASGPVAHSNEQLEILNRFGKVFDLSYTRFSDLQKAEAQAREATIEAALEKVRGKAMAMRNSDDLSSTASMVFTELRKLGINPIRSGVGIISKKSRKVQFYSATSSSNGDSLSLTGSVVMSGHPEFEKQYESWLRKENYFTVLKGEELKSYYTFLSSGLNIAAELNNQDDEKQYGHWLMFSEGFLFAWSEKEYSETEIKILERFKNIVELTFRRYIELKKSEASARDAIKQAALDRIRADIASMRTISDLDRITPLIWNELTILGIPFNRCGVFIMDDLHELIHTFLSEPDGKAIAAFHIPYDTPGSINQVLNHWQQKENYIDHWDEISFTEFANTLVKQGALTSSEQYLQTIPHGGFYLHFLPFLQGMLYVGNSIRLGEEDIKLIQSVADAFSTAYARYEDFNKLEAAKQQVDKTLVDLKQAQTQLVQSEKMASLGELTAGIAHEIQNPLNFVNNFSEVNKELLAELNEEIEKGNYEEVKIIANDVIGNEEKINHHGKRADAIVKGMLQHSRSSTGAKEPTDINALADEYLRLSYHGLRAKDKSFNAEMKTDFDQNIGKINIVPQDIGRVLLNLYNNAFYAVNEKKKSSPQTPEGETGNLQSEYKPVIAVSTKIIHPLEGKREAVELTVMDNGSGIHQKVLDKIFQPFFTTKPTGEGTGLGLSLSYDIIKAHAGEIKVETKEGEGTIFVIQLSIS